MNLANTLTRTANKEGEKKVYQYILDHPEDMEALFNLYLSEDLRICQRASAPLTLIAQKHPHLFKPFHSQLMQHIKNPPMDAALRNGLRFLQFFNIDESLEGELFDFCYSLMSDPKRPTGIRAFASYSLRNIGIKHPDLRPELIALFEEWKDHGTTGFKFRMRQCIRKLLHNS